MTLKELGDSALARSIKNCRYIGAGVVIYFRDPDAIWVSAGCELRDYSVLEVGGQLIIEPDTVIGAYNWLQASGSIKLGSNVLIGPHSVFVSTTHKKPEPRTNQRDLPLETGSVVVEDNVWIGAHVSVLINVAIGANTTIGTGSVVNRSIPANSVAHGAPCRPVESK